MMRSSWIVWTLNPITEVFIRGRKEDAESHEGEDDVKMEAKIGVMQLSQEMLEIAGCHQKLGERYGEEFSIRVSWTNQPCRHFDFELLESWTVREYISSLW